MDLVIAVVMVLASLATVGFGVTYYTMSHHERSTKWADLLGAMGVISAMIAFVCFLVIIVRLAATS